MSKYIRKARRAELANAGKQILFDFDALPPVKTTSSAPEKIHEKRMMLRTDNESIERLRRSDDRVPVYVEVLNDLISGRRMMRDADNRHRWYTRYDSIVYDLGKIQNGKGKKVRLCTKDYHEGILAVVTDVEEACHSDPLTFIVTAKLEK